MYLKPVQVSISRQAGGHGYTAVLCVLAALFLISLSIVRASPNPVVGKGFGILSNIMFAVLLVNGQFVWPQASGARAYWNYVSCLTDCAIHPQPCFHEVLLID